MLKMFKKKAISSKELQTYFADPVLFIYLADPEVTNKYYKKYLSL